ncbi:hypothetical protein ACJJTC_017086 [Scirpophaga incertulas]
MWTLEDASRIGASDMDSRRTRPTYEAGFDACEPLESVTWTGRTPARVLRRRCRSEGVDRSPYDDVCRESNRSADSYPRYRVLPDKSRFTLNNSDNYLSRFTHYCSQPTIHNGDYIMAHEQNGHCGYQPGRSKFHRSSPTRPMLVSSISNAKIDERLPKVEELLEKVDQEMMEVQMAKQPLKSILNNPLPKSAPQGILKKPKNRSYQDCKLNEGRRRQRASSESDNLYCDYHISSPIPGYDNRLSHLSSSMKRAKDNSGTGYSYGSAIANLNQSPVNKCNNNYSKSQRCTCKDQVIVTNKDETQNVHILRTTAINNETVDRTPILELSRQDTLTPTCPVVSPALPVDCNVIDGEAEDAHSTSPSPDPEVESWPMETDCIPDSDKNGKSPPTLELSDPNSISKLSTKLNGTVVSPPKNVPSKESPLSIPEGIYHCLRPSLFPRVPPYLKFVSHEDLPPVKIPLPVQKHLKWKLTTITPIVVKKTLTNSGFRLVKSECDTSECPQEGWW